MKEIKAVLRTAYVSALRGNVNYSGQVIPIDEENLNVAPALLQIGNSTGIEAYILIKNQTVNDDSAKCDINQNTSLQLDIVTVFNGNSGNSSHADAITDLVFAILFPNGGKRLQFTLPDMNMWRGWLLSSRTTVEQDTNTKTYRNLCIFNHSIGQ